MKNRPNTNPKTNQKTPGKPAFPLDETDEPIGDVLDENTTLDVIISPTGYVTELSDTVDAMDGAAVEVIDIVNQADGTDIELTIIEEPTDQPGIDSVDRFVEIKGIGPKVAELLSQAGIRSFAQLAETPVERIRDILSAAGSRYRIFDAATWPEQARQLAQRKTDGVSRSVE